MKTITSECPHCKKSSQIEAGWGEALTCPLCKKIWGRIDQIAKVFESCPFCQCRQFYVQKDFNRGLGCLVVLIGVLLVPKTYGLSLPLFALVDWLFYRRVSTMVICYRCGVEYRGFEIPSHLKPYMHHIRLKYDKYR